MARQQLRVLAGKWRGRRVLVPDYSGCRPTLTRHRQVVMDVLFQSGIMQQVSLPDQHSNQQSSLSRVELLQQISLLDLYAGTGIIAIEALSRGIKAAICVETNSACCQMLRRNCSLLSINHELGIVQEKATRFLNQQGVVKPGTIIFADPPYDINASELELLNQQVAGQLGTKNIYVLQHASSVLIPAAMGAMQRVRLLKFTRSHFSFFAARSD